MLSNSQDFRRVSIISFGLSIGAEEQFESISFMLQLDSIEVVDEVLKSFRVCSSSLERKSVLYLLIDTEGSWLLIK